MDEAEGVDHDFSLDGLNRVDDDRDGAGSELFEGLLGVDVDRGEPAAEPRMGVVPAYYGLLSVKKWSVSHGAAAWGLQRFTVLSAVAYPSFWSERLDLPLQH